MRVAYLLPILPPHLPSAEALSQEIAALRQHFPGALVYLNPNQRSPLYIPRMLFGFHLLPQLRRLERSIDLYHFYNADPFAFPVLRWLRRPVVYTIGGSVGVRPPAMKFFNALGAVTVYAEPLLRQLQAWGLRNGHVVRSGIDVTRFTHQPLPLQGQVRLLMGSAPWTLAQFASKGVDALLAAAQQRPNLHLTFLWRGVLADEMRALVAQRQLSSQVTILDGLVDVNQILATVHASIVLAAHGNVVKAYPNSLLDSLAAGKPVLVSRALPMSAYVEQMGCGAVVEQVDVLAILAALDQLLAHYDASCRTAENIGQRDFSVQQTIADYRAIYQQLAGPT
jgi:glycosyltransferase involved in cell wall biosynthesis